MNMMNNRNRLGLTFNKPENKPRASAGDELSLLIGLVQNETIGVKMLLQNVAEILRDDPNLLVNVVLLITDSKRISESDARELDYAQALISVRRMDKMKGKEVIENAISYAADQAGFVALAS